MRILSIATLVLTILTASVSCKKTGPETISDKIDGSWELRQAVGGICGSCVFDYPAGNGKIVKYSGTTYKMYNQGQLVQSGQFRIMKDTSELFQMKKDRIVYDNVLTGSKLFVEISNNKLSFTPEVYDYQVAVYNRVPGNTK